MASLRGRVIKFAGQRRARANCRVALDKIAGAPPRASV
jgi:hypothetical protein